MVTVLLIARKEVAGVDFGFHVGEVGGVSVGEDGAGASFELGEVVDHSRAEEGGAVGERRLIYNYCCAFGFDALHHALDG